MKELTEYYEIFIDDKRIGRSINRNEAWGYIFQEYEEILPFLTYEPTGVGNNEVWCNAIFKIEIKRRITPEYDLKIIELLKNISEDNVKERKAPLEINVSKVMPCTPRRTRIKKKDGQMEKAVEGKIVEKDGKKYIGKKNKKGEEKWDFYHKNTYSNRKSPEKMAKTYKEGTSKKGLDGNMWIVKVDKNGNKKWRKK